MKAHHQLGNSEQEIGRAAPLAEAVKRKEDLEVDRAIGPNSPASRVQEWLQRTGSLDS